VLIFNLHRNLLLDESGHLKVADFGLSKLLTTDAMHEQYQMTGETGTCEATHTSPSGNNKTKNKENKKTFLLMNFAPRRCKLLFLLTFLPKCVSCWPTGSECAHGCMDIRRVLFSTLKTFAMRNQWLRGKSFPVKEPTVV
jgi:serine/threonine protein kinase